MPYFSRMLLLLCSLIWLAASALTVKPCWRQAIPMSYLSVASPDWTLAAVPNGFGEIELYRLDDGALVRRLPGHSSDDILNLVFSPDGKLLASCGHDLNDIVTDLAVKVWRVEDGTLLCTLSGQMYQMAFSPDGACLATAGIGREINLWSVATGRLLRTIVPKEYPRALAFSPDGVLLAAGHDVAVTLWHPADGTLVATLPGQEKGVSDLAFLPDGRLATAGHNGTVKLWQTMDGKLLQSFGDGTQSFRSLAVSRDGMRLAAAGYQHSVTFWSLVGEAEETRFTTRQNALALALSPDGREFMCFTPTEGLAIRHSETFDILRPIVAGGRGAQREVVFSADGTLVISGSDTGRVCFWRTTDGTLQRTLMMPEEREVRSLAVSPDGALLAAGGGGRIMLWSIPDSELVREIPAYANYLHALAFSPDGTLLASGGADEFYEEQQQVKLWKVADGTLARALPVGKEDGYNEMSLSFSPDGAILAMSTLRSGILTVWQVADGKVLATLQGQNGRSHSIAFSRDGQTLLSSTADQEIRRWSVKTFATGRAIPFTGPFALSPNGQYLAVSRGQNINAVALVRLADSRVMAIMPGPDDAISYAFSRDGEYVAVVGAGGLGIWEITWQE